ncbi:skin secretory protein xP2-like [Ursus arctos]|uniref:skin secretory protein xP2-like n=1 Tax=Ursus arctos TaxID=9644 RepID=UPI0025496F12|nr:skin secretory protein xP2-like [Ursus arctos]
MDSAPNRPSLPPEGRLPGEGAGAGAGAPPLLAGTSTVHRPQPALPAGPIRTHARLFMRKAAAPRSAEVGLRRAEPGRAGGSRLELGPAGVTVTVAPAPARARSPTPGERRLPGPAPVRRGGAPGVVQEETDSAPSAESAGPEPRNRGGRRRAVGSPAGHPPRPASRGSSSPAEGVQTRKN